MKSNLLRHMRTLHNQLLSPLKIDDDRLVGDNVVETVSS